MIFSFVTRFNDPSDKGRKKIVFQVRAESPEDREKVLTAIGYDTGPTGFIGSYSTTMESTFVDVIFPEGELPAPNFPLMLGSEQLALFTAG